MLKELSERLHMIMSVHGFLEHEQATIETILPLVAPERVKLNDFINVVFKLSGKASFDSTGYAVGKKELRDKLTVEAYRIGKAAAMYYTMVVSDQTLYERAQINRTQLKRLSAGDLVNKARLISQTALPIKTLLLPYGVDAATVDALPGHIEADRKSVV